MSEATVIGTRIEMRRRYAAPRERVFRAWTDAADLERWYAPVEGWVVSRADVDARAGGGYHLEFGPPGAEPIVETGTYEAFDPPGRLVIRVHLQGKIATEDTTVEVTFHDVAGETEVVVVEGEYSTPEIARKHAGGWTTMLEQLARLVGPGR